MKVTILSGSPKGDKSVSLQSMNYLRKKFPDHDYSVFYISKTIKRLISDRTEFEKIIDSVKNSRLVVWVTPVYSFLIPSQFKRFIELIYENNCQDAFIDKYAAVITTSISFFDHCAANYLRSISEDLEMGFVGSYSGDSYDLLNEDERERLHRFGDTIFENSINNSPHQKIFFKPEYKTEEYTPGKTVEKIPLKDKRLLVIKDRAYSGENIEKMTERFSASIDGKVNTISLEDLDIKGGCTGCIQCGFDHKCMYEGSDGFTEFFDNHVKKADIILMAGETKDRWLSYKWKEFFDRSFFNNHVPMLRGKQIGIIATGPVSSLANLNEIIEAFCQWQRANLCGIVSDEHGDIDSNITNLAKRLISASEKEYIAPANFLGKGGHKIFRDDIWGRHRFVFQKDHKWYEENGFYDFPQEDKAAIEMSENMIKLTKDPQMREAIRKMLRTEMVKPHLKIIEEA